MKAILRKCVAIVFLFAWGGGLNASSCYDISGCGGCGGILFQSMVLLPSSQALNFAVQTHPISQTSSSRQVVNVRPHYHFGFLLGIESWLRNGPDKVTLLWQHFNSTDSVTRQVTNEDVITPLFESDALFYKRAWGRVSFRCDIIDFLGTARLFDGCFLHADGFFGLGGGRIRQNLSSQFTNLDGSIKSERFHQASFVGTGPTIGVDFSYHTLGGFYFNGRASASLYVGVQRSHTTHDSTRMTNFIESCRMEKNYSILPALQGKLALGYFSPFCCYYSFNIELGYSAQVYINAFCSLELERRSRTFDYRRSDFGLSGPYMSFGVWF